MAPVSITLFLPSGEPMGIRVIEISGHTLTGIVVPRILFPEFKNREEYKRTGVYILVGANEESADTKLYVGEADPVGPRIEAHIKNKGFWSYVIMFTAQGNGLHKAHVQYLESRLHTLAAKAKKCSLDNGNSPALPTLKESHLGDAEGYLKDILLCLPILGADYFTQPTKKSSAAQDYYFKSRGIVAHGYETNSGFVVMEGSQAIKKTTCKAADIVHRVRKQLVDRGILVDKGEFYEMAQDYEFNSPSLAGACMVCATCGGRVAWKTKDGKTLKEIQDARG